jgi:hypothetical protein
MRWADAESLSLADEGGASIERPAPLTAAAAGALLEGWAGRALPADLRRRVFGLSAGNPMLLEQRERGPPGAISAHPDRRCQPVGQNSGGLWRGQDGLRRHRGGPHPAPLAFFPLLIPAY